MRQIIVILVLMLASACAKRHCQSDPAYLEAQEYPALKAPPGLDAPPPDANLAIPKTGTGAKTKQSPEDCLEVPPRLPLDTTSKPKAGKS
ncbi:MAG: hypothetical protein ACRETN_05025 [Nevskiales bacterium]